MDKAGKSDVLVVGIGERGVALGAWKGLAKGSKRSAQA